MITIGVDFHKRTSSYCVFDSKGEKMKQTKIENKPELVQQFLEGLTGPKRLAMEATRNWGLFHQLVEPHVDEFLLGHPRKMKLITESENKHDRKDAELIGQLAQTSFFPQAYVSSPDVRQLRSLLRFRNFLVRQRAAIRNQVQILLDRNLWPCERPTSFKNIFCVRGIRWMKQLKLPDRERFILDQALLTFEQLSSQIESHNAMIVEQAPQLPDLIWLKQVPGFRKGGVNSYIVLLELADIQRFKKAKHFAHYAGLIPSEHSSGDSHRTGRLVKEANRWLRTALIESSLAAIRVDAGLKAYYQTVKKRAGSGAAVIACARKLSYAVYHVLKDKTAYRPFDPPATAFAPCSISQ